MITRQKFRYLVVLNQKFLTRVATGLIPQNDHYCGWYYTVALMRTAEFDTEFVLQAMHAFMQYGYAKTSMQKLKEVTHFIRLYLRGLWQQKRLVFSRY